jgi:hypothetical protein
LSESSRFNGITGVVLLPYHSLGETKYQRFGREYRLAPRLRVARSRAMTPRRPDAGVASSFDKRPYENGGPRHEGATCKIDHVIGDERQAADKRIARSIRPRCALGHRKSFTAR